MYSSLVFTYICFFSLSTTKKNNLDIPYMILQTVLSFVQVFRKTDHMTLTFNNENHCHWLLVLHNAKYITIKCQRILLDNG